MSFIRAAEATLHDLSNFCIPASQFSIKIARWRSRMRRLSQPGDVMLAMNCFFRAIAAMIESVGGILPRDNRYDHFTP
jgi:hypothetical protein